MKCLSLALGTSRTDLAANSVFSDGNTEDYSKRLEPWYGFLRMQAKEGNISEGDPKTLAQRVLELAEVSGLGKRYSRSEWDGKLIRVLMGSDSYAYWGSKLQELQRVYPLNEEVALSTRADS